MAKTAYLRLIIVGFHNRQLPCSRIKVFEVSKTQVQITVCKISRNVLRNVSYLNCTASTDHTFSTLDSGTETPSVLLV